MRSTAGTSRRSDATAPPQGRGGEVPDFDEVAERYADTIHRMAYALTRDPDDARDLAQDVFVRVHRNLDRYSPGTFEGWLYRVTKNLFLDGVRRRGRVRVEPLPEETWRELRDLGPGPADEIEVGVLRADLDRALRRLPVTFRTAVILTDVQGLTYAEIADRVSWPIGTVRSRVHRGRKALRDALVEEVLVPVPDGAGDQVRAMDGTSSAGEAPSDLPR
ncbi:MAG: sigma-70 family RNA polymerase sigma factor [Actinobacteria bacterium]|nr:sigma-70 family RNA polymerase sigma factor [Actinomycetota bacterium]